MRKQYLVGYHSLCKIKGIKPIADQQASYLCSKVLFLSEQYIQVEQFYSGTYFQ